MNLNAQEKDTVLINSILTGCDLRASARRASRQLEREIADARNLWFYDWTGRSARMPKGQNPKYIWLHLVIDEVLNTAKQQSPQFRDAAIRTFGANVWLQNEQVNRCFEIDRNGIWGKRAIL